MARSWLKRHSLTVFLGASVAVGSALTFLAAQLPASSALKPLAAIPISYVPTVLVLIVLMGAGTSEERRAFRRRLTTLRVGWQWYAVALLALPAIHAAGVGLATLTGGQVAVHPAMLVLLPLFLLTNLGEEIGWRGYALPKLQERFSPLVAAILLGLVWGAFHWVALLGNADAPLGYAVAGTVQLTAMSVIMTFVFNNARQAVPVMVLMHAAYDTVSIGVLPLAETGVPLQAFSLSAVVASAVAIGLAIATGPGLGVQRRETLTAPNAGVTVR